MNSFLKHINPELFEPLYRGIIVHYWEDICYFHAQLSQTEKKELFLFLIEIMITENKLRFQKIKQTDTCNPTAAEITKFFRENWPKSFSDLSSNNDPDLWSFFYSMPGAIWLDEDNQWIAS